ncbi:MAG TPA: hypothetical protein VOA88_01220 [Candidatus Dormibacteraeota bacterium]|nr:hypothetical protein [Candidatus Dormibacteraeota bacterium]
MPFTETGVKYPVVASAGRRKRDRLAGRYDSYSVASNFKGKNN